MIVWKKCLLIDYPDIQQKVCGDLQGLLLINHLVLLSISNRQKFSPKLYIKHYLRY